MDSYIFTMCILWGVVFLSLITVFLSEYRGAMGDSRVFETPELVNQYIERARTEKMYFRLSLVGLLATPLSPVLIPIFATFAVLFGIGWSIYNSKRFFVWLFTDKEF